MAALDYETKTSYMVTVMVTDDGTPAMTASIDVTINVTNDTTDATTMRRCLLKVRPRLAR